MSGYFCFGFIDFILAGKTLTEYRNLFSANNFKENDDMILKYFLNNTSHMYKIESCCLKCRKDSENIDTKVPASSNGRAMIHSKCVKCVVKNRD